MDLISSNMPKIVNAINNQTSSIKACMSEPTINQYDIFSVTEDLVIPIAPPPYQAHTDLTYGPCPTVEENPPFVQLYNEQRIPEVETVELNLGDTIVIDKVNASGQDITVDFTVIKINDDGESGISSSDLGPISDNCQSEVNITRFRYSVLGKLIANGSILRVDKLNRQDDKPVITVDNRRYLSVDVFRIGHNYTPNRDNETISCDASFGQNRRYRTSDNVVPYGIINVFAKDAIEGTKCGVYSWKEFFIRDDFEPEVSEKGSDYDGWKYYGISLSGKWIHRAPTNLYVVMLTIPKDFL